MMAVPSFSSQVMTLEQMKSLLTEPYSCFKLVCATKHITLLPKYIGAFGKGIIEELASEVRYYQDDLDGVLMGYENVRRLQRAGRIIEHNPQIHLDIQADFVIFQPSIGAILKGIVNKLGKDHIGVLVHQCFNGSIPKPRQVVGDAWPADTVTLGEEVVFKVSKIFTQQGIVSMSGELTDESLAQLAQTKSKKRKASECDIDETSDATSKPKKKKKKKDKSECSSAASADAAEVPAINTSIEVTKKKKKKKKDKQDSVISLDSTAESIISTNESELGTSDELDGKKKTKKKKKHKVKVEVDLHSDSLVGDNETVHVYTPLPGTSLSAPLSSSTPAAPPPPVMMDIDSNDLETGEKRKKKKKKKDKSVTKSPTVLAAPIPIAAIKRERDTSSVGSNDSGVGLSCLTPKGEVVSKEKKKKKKKIKVEGEDNVHVMDAAVQNVIVKDEKAGVLETFGNDVPMVCDVGTQNPGVKIEKDSNVVSKKHKSKKHKKVKEEHV